MNLYFDPSTLANPFSESYIPLPQLYSVSCAFHWIHTDQRVLQWPGGQSPLPTPQAGILPHERRIVGGLAQMV